MTKTDWERFEKAIDSLFGQEHLLCDGYVVTVGTVRHKNSIVWDVYVDGEFRGEWVLQENKGADIPRRFLPLRKKGGTTEKEKKRLIRIIGKGEADRLGLLKGPFTMRHVYHNTPKALIRHLRKHNQQIHWLCQHNQP
ncbi:hypothetical protein [Magnetococcus sp. PR-3]|uniref:hypothetical protein n=1 Tax=Magnetococcus sp. PR-3 TaxID=3120355 RepID=UPI002FCE0F49